MTTQRRQFVWNEERDPHVGAWVARQKNLSQAIRDLITAADRPAIQLDAGTVRRIVREELAGLALVTAGGAEPGATRHVDDQLAAALADQW